MSDPRSPAERIVDRAVDETERAGRPLSRAALQYQRSIENYLKAGNRPRWMERVVEIDRGVERETRLLQRAYDALREEVGGDPEQFARRWRATAEAWSFEELNVLVHQHNEWYPIERQLPVDLRTRDYVLLSGKSYRRPLLDAAWILERFPA